MPLRPWPYLAGVLALAAVYYAAAMLGLSLASPEAEQVTVVWPPSGIALAALLLGGYHWWPGIALGAFLANAQVHEPPLVACGIALGNALEAVVGATLLHRVVGFHNALERLRDVLGLMVLAAGVSTAVGATVGVTSLCLGGVHRWDEFVSLWWTWWLGDAMGGLVAAPVLLTWAAGPRSDWPSERTAEAAALLFGLGAVSAAVFTGGGPGPTPGHPLEYTIFPFAVWAALRFGQRGAAAVTLTAAAVAVYGTRQGFGPFAGGAPHQSLVLLQLYMAVVAATALLLGAAVAERRTAERRRAVGYAATAVLAESASLAEAAPRLLQVICEHLDWDVGALWTVDRPANVLRCVSVWHGPSTAVAGFVKATQARTFAPGVGLPGRVWSYGKAGWIPDVTQDTNFPRAEAAARDGLHSAFGFPILLGSDTLGVIEFFSQRIQEPDDDLLRMLSAVGGQVGLCSERKRAEEDLGRERELLQKVFDRIPVMIVMYEPSTRVLRLNREFERLTCWSTDAARDVDLMAHCYPDPACREEARAYMESLQEGWKDFDVTTKDGRVLHSSWSNIRLSDDTHVGIGIDIRDRKQAETEQKQLEERLRHHAIELADANRRKDEFLATLAHELRNPLAPIRNAVHLLKSPTADLAVAEQAREMLERQVQYLVRLVDDLLDVSRIMRGRVELRRERIDLAVVVERAVETARPAIEAGGHDLTVAPPTEPVELDADPVRLAQVVANLLNNAAKYTERGGRIDLTVGREGGQAVVRVRDTGIGIAAEDLPHVFDPFVQADNTLDRAQGGLGIGLTLVRTLVDLHGGRVEAHSAGPGRGSEFVVRLPLVSATSVGWAESSRPTDREPVAASVGLEDSAHPTLSAQAVRRRVLVVDDNVDAAASLALLLRLEGHDVAVAHSGPAALDAARDKPPEVVFLDIGMPGMDGCEAARRLRPMLADTLLIAVTGWGQEKDRQRTREAGFDRHLVKPVEMDEVRAILNSPRSSRPSPLASPFGGSGPGVRT